MEGVEIKQKRIKGISYLKEADLLLPSRENAWVLYQIVIQTTCATLAGPNNYESRTAHAINFCIGMIIAFLGLREFVFIVR
jgi:uncharacterized protein with PQ loop repeat